MLVVDQQVVQLAFSKERTTMSSQELRKFPSIVLLSEK